MRPRAPRSLLAALAAFLGLLGCIASAQAQIFPEGFSINPIDPAAPGDRFLLVPDGSTDPDVKGKPPVRAMLFGHYTLNPSLVSVDAAGNSTAVIDNQLYGHVAASVIPLRWLLLALDLPVALVQEGTPPAGVTAPGTHVGDLRATARFGIVGKRTSPFALAPAVDVWFPTGSPENLTGDDTVRVEPMVNMSGKVGLFVYAAKGGFLIRRNIAPPGPTGPTTEVGPSITFGAAAGLSVFKDVLQIGPELSGSVLAISDAGLAFSDNTSRVSSALAARVQLGDFNIGAGAGLGLSRAPGVASRLFLALSYAPVASSSKDSFKAAAVVEAEGEVDFDDDPPEPEPEPEPEAAPPPAPAPPPPPPPPPPRATPAAAPPPPAEAPGPSVPAATMVGFRKTGENSALVYVQLTETTDVRSSQDGKTLTFTMKGISVPKRNNRNPLVATHFDSIVDSARLVPAGKDTNLVIVLRREAKASAQVVRMGAGAQLEVHLTAEPKAEPKAEAEPKPQAR